MRTISIATALSTTILLLTSHAQLLPFLTKDSPQPSLRNGAPEDEHQNPMAQPPSGPGIQLPPSSPAQPTGAVILSDILSTQRTINVFAGFTRDIETVATRLDTADLNTTVLAPLNSAITSLPRKPWEDPRDFGALGADAYAGKQGEDRAHGNMRRFVEAHVVPASPWEEGEKRAAMGGGVLWWEIKDGRAVVMPGEVEVEKVVSRVANGEVWVLRGVVNYASS